MLKKGDPKELMAFMSDNQMLSSKFVTEGIPKHRAFRFSTHSLILSQLITYVEEHMMMTMIMTFIMIIMQIAD